MAVSVETLFIRFGPMVHRRCARILRDAHEAEDAMQDVFVRVIARQEQLVDDRMGALLWTMSTQVCLNRLRRKNRKPEHGSELLDQIASADDAEEQVHRLRFLDRIFGRETSAHGVQTRTLAVLRWVDGMTWEEISQATGMSVAGIRKRLDGFRYRMVDLRVDETATGRLPALSDGEST